MATVNVYQTYLPSGALVWMITANKYHRTDGPAYIRPDGYVEWHVNGIRITSQQRFQQVSGMSDQQMASLVLQWGRIGDRP